MTTAKKPTTTTRKPAAKKPEAQNEPNIAQQKQKDIITIFGPDRQITIYFGNGSEIMVDGAELSAELQNHALKHGLKQKIIDAAALGKGASISEKFDACLEVADRLKFENEWNATSRSGGGRQSILLQALIVLYPRKTPDQLSTWIKSKTSAERAALERKPEINQAIMDIRAEQSKSVENVDDMLDELN